MANRTEDIAAKALGTVKAAKATMAGLRGVFKQLTVEHGEVSALLKRVQLSSDADIRAELFPKIRRELLAHEEGELRNVYPMFAQNPETARFAEDHAQEAAQLHDQLEQLSATAVDSSEWQAKFDRLVELVTQHAKEEESEYFPAGQRAFAERADELLKAYLETKERMLDELTHNMPV